MSETNNGGLEVPARDNPYSSLFPRESGMTLRDYFAVQVMPAMLSMCQYADGEWDHDTVAQNAYSLADAMLKERAA